MPTNNLSHTDCPYKGLLSYTKQDADLFCGRTHWIQSILGDLYHQPFVALTGASGSGKTSLINAGLIPELLSKNSWQIAAFRPKESPFYELSKALIPFLAGHLNPFDQNNETKRLSDGFRSKQVSLFEVSQDILEKYTPDSRFLLVIDQFEELYALCPLAEERNLFLELLLDAVDISTETANHGFNVLIALRADFLGQILSDRRMSSYLTRADHKLAPMSPDELREAIELPAQHSRTLLEPGLADYILKTCIPTNIPLPLISFSLKCLWEKDHGQSMTIRGFEEMGATELALSNYAEAIYECLSKKEKSRTRQIFLRLVSPGEGTEDVRCMINRNEMISRNWPLINQFIEKGLLTAERNQNDEIVQIEVVHDILLKEWGRLHGWIQENRDFRLWRKRLQSKMWYWEKNGQKIEDLLTGDLLIDSMQWMLTDPDSIEFSEKRYIQASNDKNKPGKTKKRLAFIGRFLILSAIVCTLAFSIWHLMNMTQAIELLHQNNIQLNKTLLATQKKLTDANTALIELDQKYQNGQQTWKDALEKATTADQRIQTANEELQQAKDLQWRSERQITFAKEKIKQSEALLEEVQKKNIAIKEQTQEFERHYQEQVTAIQSQTIAAEEKAKQADIKMLAAEQLAKDARAQLQLASEKQAQFNTAIQTMKQQKAELLEAACAFAVTPLTSSQWQLQREQSPLKKLCEEKK
ncbi:MAG: hypothetical protein HQK75_15945 [Candidatus Magnetomorum sp.]|nr:hypothetical protein [Candidatus Magnetomorum sp.]